MSFGHLSIFSFSFHMISYLLNFHTRKFEYKTNCHWEKQIVCELTKRLRYIFIRLDYYQILSVQNINT